MAKIVNLHFKKTTAKFPDPEIELFREAIDSGRARKTYLTDPGAPHSYQCSLRYTVLRRLSIAESIRMLFAKLQNARDEGYHILLRKTSCVAFICRDKKDSFKRNGATPLNERVSWRTLPYDPSLTSTQKNRSRGSRSLWRQKLNNNRGGRPMGEKSKSIISKSMGAKNRGARNTLRRNQQKQTC